MGRGKNTFNFAGGFNIAGQEPIDSRLVVAAVADLTDASTWNGVGLYNGLVVTTKDTNELYILTNRDNVTSTASWKKAGDGKGTIQAADYNAAVALATNDNIGQIIYALADCSVGETTYQSGPYMVTGAGTLVKLAQTSPSGEIEPRVSALESRMSKADSSIAALETAVGKIKDSSAEATDNGIRVKVESKEGNVTSVTVDASGAGAVKGAKAGTIDVSIDADKKLELGTMALEDADDYLKTEDTSIFTEEEKTKLATVAKGARINRVAINTMVAPVMTDEAGNSYQNIEITEGTADGTFRIHGIDGSYNDVSVHGLKSAAFKDATEFDASGAAHDVSVYVDTELAKKINVADSSNFTKVEKDKLAAIAEGAQVNVLEGVKVNGTELDIDANKKVNVEIPTYAGENAIVVSDVADNSAKVSLKLNDSCILSQNADGLKATLSIAYNDQKIQLKGIEGKLISEFDASMFIKDGMIEDVSLVVNPEGKEPGTYLKITFNTSSGKQPIWVNVTSLIDVYTAGNGIEINGKAISVKKDTDDEGYLTISENGVKVTGINDAIANAVAGLAKDASLQAVSEKLDDVSTKLSSANTKISDVSTALDAVIANLAKTDSSLADVSTRLSDVSTRLSTEKGRIDTLLTELAGSGYIKKVSIASDCDSLTATTDSSGYVSLGITSKLQNVIDGFSAKLNATDITTGSTDGTIAVKGSDVAVKGLKSAAYEDSSAFLAHDSMNWQVLS